MGQPSQQTVLVTPDRAVAILDALDISHAFEEATAEALKEGVGKIVEDVAKAQGTSHLWSVLGEEAAKVLVGSVATPFLRLLLGAADKSSAKVHKLIREPFETGVRLAKDMLSLAILTPEDQELKKHLFNAALERLESAYTLTDRKALEERFFIRLIQAIIGLHLGATAYARQRLADFGELLDAACIKARTDLEEAQKHFDDCASSVHIYSMFEQPFEYTTACPPDPRNYSEPPTFVIDETDLRRDLVLAEEALASAQQKYSTFIGLRRLLYC